MARRRDHRHGGQSDSAVAPAAHRTNRLTHRNVSMIKKHQVANDSARNQTPEPHRGCWWNNKGPGCDIERQAASQAAPLGSPIRHAERQHRNQRAAGCGALVCRPRGLAHAARIAGANVLSFVDQPFFHRIGKNEPSEAARACKTPAMKPSTVDRAWSAPSCLASIVAASADKFDGQPRRPWLSACADARKDETPQTSRSRPNDRHQKIDAVIKMDFAKREAWARPVLAVDTNHRDAEPETSSNVQPFALGGSWLAMSPSVAKAQRKQAQKYSAGPKKQRQPHQLRRQNTSHAGGKEKRQRTRQMPDKAESPSPHTLLGIE